MDQFESNRSSEMLRPWQPKPKFGPASADAPSSGSESRSLLTRLASGLVGFVLQTVHDIAFIGFCAIALLARGPMLLLVMLGLTCLALSGLKLLMGLPLMLTPPTAAGRPALLLAEAGYLSSVLLFVHNALGMPSLAWLLLVASGMLAGFIQMQAWRLFSVQHNTSSEIRWRLQRAAVFGFVGGVVGGACNAAAGAPSTQLIQAMLAAYACASLTVGLAAMQAMRAQEPEESSITRDVKRLGQVVGTSVLHRVGLGWLPFYGPNRLRRLALTPFYLIGCVASGAILIPYYERVVGRKQMAGRA